MSTTRRQFLATGAAALLLPTWLLRSKRVRHLDLSTFCEVDDYQGRFNLTTPFHQEGFTYATDARVCVRTALPVDLATAEECRRPKANRLPWEHEKKCGWKSWDTAVRQQTDIEPDCPTCFGRGRFNCKQCERCEGSCWRTEYTNDGFADAEKPCECRTGWVGGTACPECRGSGAVDYVMRIGGVCIAPIYHAKVATLGPVDFVNGGVPPDAFTKDNRTAVLFRFDGGDGMVMPLANLGDAR